MAIKLTFWIILLLLTLSVTCGNEVNNHKMSSPSDTITTPPSSTSTFNPELNTLTDLVAIPERGVLLQRQGTVLSHPSIEIMTAVVTFEKFDWRVDEEFSYMCYYSFQPVIENINRTIAIFKRRTTAVFEATNIFTTEDICYILEADPSKCRVGRQKRLAIAVSAMIVASASMGIAVTGLSLATANRIELEKIQEYVAQNADRINNLEERLQLVADKQEVILDTQYALLGYVQNITEAMSKLAESVDCSHDIIYVLRWQSEIERRLSDILQFIDKGTNFGQLTPSLIDPAMLRKFLKADSRFNGGILARHPNILYQTAMASLIKANFEHLQFTFIISFPKFENNPFYPFFSVKQTGFNAKLDNGTSDVCLRFSLPDTVILHDSELYSLNTPLLCPTYGNVMICANSQMSLYPLDECLRRDNSSQAVGGKRHKYLLTENGKCPLTKCFPDNRVDTYISTTGGILIKTNQKNITLIYNRADFDIIQQQTAVQDVLRVPETGTIFIPWRENISSVGFGSIVVYSPTHAEHIAHFSISTHAHILPAMSLTDLFDIPKLSTEKIRNLLESQKARIAELEAQFQPSLLYLQQWARNQFTLPPWIKYLLAVSFGVAMILVGQRLISCIYSRRRSRTENAPAVTIVRDAVPEPAAPSVVYETLKTVIQAPTEYRETSQLGPSVMEINPSYTSLLPPPALGEELPVKPMRASARKVKHQPPRYDNVPRFQNTH